MFVYRLSAGLEHSAALTCLGHVYTWGSNNSYQLGRKAMLTHRPGLVPSLQGHCIFSVACGDKHTSFVGADTQSPDNTSVLLMAGQRESAGAPTLVNTGDIGDIASIECGGDVCSIVTTSNPALVRAVDHLGILTL